MLMVVVVQLFYGAVSLQSSELGSNSNKQKNIDNNEQLKTIRISSQCQISVNDGK